MSVSRFFLFLVCGLSLAACATPYQPKGLTGGVDATRLNDRTLLVDARANGYSSPERVKDFVYLRAAEETLKAGYHSFLIMQAEDTSRSTYTYSDASSTTRIDGTATNLGYQTNYNATARTTYTPAQATEIFKPGMRTTVLFLTEQEAVKDYNSINARMIYHQLAPKYISEQDRLPGFAPY